MAMEIETERGAVCLNWRINSSGVNLRCEHERARPGVTNAAPGQRNFDSVCGSLSQANLAGQNRMQPNSLGEIVIQRER